MSTSPKVRIEMSSHGRGKVLIDDVEVKGVRKISFMAGVDETNIVTLELLAADVKIEGEADVIKQVDITDLTSASREFKKG